MINVININTGEVYASFDSWYLARLMVNRVNTAVGRRIVRAVEV